MFEAIKGGQAIDEKLAKYDPFAEPSGASKTHSRGKQRQQITDLALVSRHQPRLSVAQNDPIGLSIENGGTMVARLFDR
jgi:hypothetical protein